MAGEQSECKQWFQLHLAISSQAMKKQTEATSTQLKDRRSMLM